MFTGIVEEIGKVRENSKFLKIEAKKVLEDLKVGDSIAVDGVCLTVLKIDGTTFQTEVMFETLKVTTLGELRSGNVVNLERALKATDRLSGHILSGHIDGICRIVQKDSTQRSVVLTFSYPHEFQPYIIRKGSIAVDGVSLTVSAISSDTFSVSLTPYTLENTSLGQKRIGEKCNVELDLIGKYVERFLSKEKKEGMELEFLKEHGFA
jgi:riboflavin synthase